VVYLTNTYQPDFLAGTDPFTYAFFGLFLASIALSIRYANAGGFAVTPMDLLVVLAILVLAMLASKGMVDTNVTAIALKTIILFYGAELVLNRMTGRWNVFTMSVLGSLLVLGVRGVIANF
jgi:UDP-GlcNAc:undecaprenyl-phosphate GlcNAc-1-phosphate transferase